MGRNVKPRLNWEEDSMYLRRLTTAIEIDESLSIELRREAVTCLNTLRSIFLKHASRRIDEESTKNPQ